MIVIPVKTNKENPAVSTLFGKSKWFAFIDDNGTITIESNKIQSGREVVENFVEKGVDKLVFNNMGGNPFMLLQKAHIECFHSGDERVLLEEVLQKLEDNKLIKVDGTNMANYVEQGKMHNGGNKHHSHDHDHDHDHNHQH
ncbi:MAG: NifB/NifX family molybdenum-iron cluster-binding protein [Campylobacterota bacterium]|nr:NifB/NifX family molybdenum-iron cluster-binding protein [Campylobacterota bacterium]